MPTNRTPIKRVQMARITPAAIERWQRMLALREQCTCPDAATAPYPGTIFNSADPACVARHELYRIERARYEAKRAACKACPQWEIEHAALLAELGIERLPLWMLDVYALPEVVAALDEAAEDEAAAEKVLR